MMTPAVAGMLRRHFGASTASDFLEALLRHKLDERDRQEREERIEQEADEALEFAVAVVTAEETAAFRVELDAYDAATVAALHENEHALVEAREHVGKLLARAHVLPDGRRVFETEDGLRVFDERGNELDASVITPEEVDDSKPRWEELERGRDVVKALEEQRTEILDYQVKLDDARERVDAGDMTHDEFERLRESLKAEMPDAVRDQIPALADREAEAKSDMPQTMEKLDISDDMVPASSAASGPALSLRG